MSRLRLATRGSRLALAQSEQVATRLRAVLGLETELVVIRTSGDRLRDVPLSQLGGKGLFVKEIEEALLAGQADVAVHSGKDLPAALAPGLALAAFPEREDPRDALVARDPGARVAALPRGARVGTGSARRRALLLAARPDLEVVPLRGNVPTRLRKLEEEGLDAVVLACAGLARLGLADRIGERIAPELLLPAVCQGTLALEVRAGDPLARSVAALDDAPSTLAARAERAFLGRLGGDCNVPLAGFADTRPGGRVRVRGLVARPDGRSVVRAERECAEGDAEKAAEEVAEEVLASGGEAILRDLRGGDAA
jgi:hydroxymethylbilane synthase